MLKKHLPISSGAGQHFVDANNVEGMESHPNVELIFAGVLHHVLVGANTSCLEGLGAQLLVLIGHQVHAQREVLDGRLLLAQIEDADLWVWHTTAEPRLWVRLVFAVTVTVN